jgi:hypothetical protein
MDPRVTKKRIKTKEKGNLWPEERKRRKRTTWAINCSVIRVDNSK